MLRLLPQYSRVTTRPDADRKEPRVYLQSGQSFGELVALGLALRLQVDRSLFGNQREEEALVHGLGGLLQDRRATPQAHLGDRVDLRGVARVGVEVGGQVAPTRVPFAYAPPAIDARPAHAPEYTAATAGGAVAVKGASLADPALLARHRGASLRVLWDGAPLPASAVELHTHGAVVFAAPPGAGANHSFALEVAGKRTASARFAYPPPSIGTVEPNPRDVVRRGRITLFGAGFGGVAHDALRVTVTAARSTPRAGPARVAPTRFFDGSTTTFSIPLDETAGWRKDPKNSLFAWPRPSQCDMIEVLSGLSGLRILGDLTDWYESIALDAVSLKAPASGRSEVPTCAQGTPDASVCTC